MPTFTYTARGKDGNEYTETKEAADRFALFREIRKGGGTIVSIHETRGARSRSFLQTISQYVERVPLSDVITFARNLAAMVDAGLPISRALGVLERQMHNKTLKRTFADIRERISKGTSFSDALEAHPRIFSKLFIAMVRSGEESGGLADALDVVGRQMEEAHELKRKVRGAMMYPGIILTVMIIIGALMLVYIVPTLSETFEELGSELPATTQLVISVSNFLRDNLFLAIVLALAAVGGFIFGIRTQRGQRVFHFFILHVPIIRGLVKQVNSARMARTLSSLLSSGVEVVSALDITRDVLQNTYFKEVLVRAKESIQKGVSISSEFEKAAHLYPPLVGEMVAVGEETGKLSDMLGRVAVFYEGEVAQKTKDMSTIVEPFLMVVIGAAVGFFALSMISPIYSLTDSF